jgi:hypothetical protein
VTSLCGWRLKPQETANLRERRLLWRQRPSFIDGPVRKSGLREWAKVVLAAGHVTLAELQLPGLPAPAHVRTGVLPPGAPRYATQKPADAVSNPESEHGRKRNGYLHDKPKLRL